MPVSLHGGPLGRLPRVNRSVPGIWCRCSAPALLAGPGPAALVASLVAASRCPGLPVAAASWLLLPALVGCPGALAGGLLLSLVGWVPCLRASSWSRTGQQSDRSTHPPGGSVLVNIFPATQTSLSFLIISFYPFFECGVDLH